MKQRLTDRALAALKPKAKQYDLMDADVPGLGVRVGKTSKAFILLARFPGSKNPTRRTIGDYGVMTLAEARDKAREWRKLLSEGNDPSVEEERRKLAQARRQENSFASVAETYFEHLRRMKLRGAHEVERAVRRELIPRWAKRPITDIKREDLLEIIDACIKNGSPSAAHHVHSYTSRMWNWAIERGTYGLESSPADRLRPAKVIGPKVVRKHILSDDELRALWHAADETGYPFGPFVQILILTGQRRNEVAGMRWREIKDDVWTVPAERFKSNATHLVPLSSTAVAILESLPRFKKGDYLFSTTMGEKPISGFSKSKRRLDKKMRLALGEFEPFRLHDIRRSMRTGLSALKISDTVAEMCIGHGAKGLRRVYDQHRYVAEMREAMNAWAARLRDLVTPPPANVVKLGAVR
jgi:integrase